MSGFKRAKKKVDLEKADAFIEGAEKPPVKKNKEKKPVPKNNIEGNKRATTYPWDSANELIIKGVNLRLTEPQWMKLKHITVNTPFSMQKFIMSVLEPEIEKKLKELIKK